MIPKTQFETKRFLLLLFFFVAGFSKLSFGVTASFNSSVIQGCAPLFVSFTNTSTDATSYVWNFGNGNSSIEINPVATFTNPGTYNVTLVATGPGGTSTISHPIVVFPNPTANFSASLVNGCQALSVSFASSSTPGAGPILDYYWYFGDGNSFVSNTTTNAANIYNNWGQYSVSLQVTDVNGCTDIEIKNSYITVYALPQISFSADPVIGCEVPISIQFTGLIGGGASPSWNFGDGGVSYIMNPEHTYNVMSNYTVSLSGVSPEGCVGTSTIPNFIQLQNIVADFTVDTLICKGDFPQIVNFTTGAGEYIWTIDGVNYTGIVPTPFPINVGGWHTITLNASTNFDCLTSLTKTFYVESNNPAIVPPFNFVCEVPTTVNLAADVSTNLASNSFTYSWTVSEINQSSNNAIFPVNILSNDSIIQNKHEDYFVKLIVQSAQGCIDSIKIDPCIWIDIPDIGFYVDDYDACVIDSVSFINTTVYNTIYDNVAQYTWHLWDGSDYIGLNPPPAVWDQIGMYELSLELITAQGCTHIYEPLPYSEDTIPDVPQFTFSFPDTTCAFPPIQIVSNLPDSSIYAWYFSDQNWIVNLDTPYVVPVDTGNLSLTLVACKGVCCDNIDLGVISYVKGPVSYFDYTRSCNNPLGIQFFPDSSFHIHPILGNLVLDFVNGGFVDVDRFYWNFGDGSPIDSTDTTPYHVFPGSGYYNVSLTTYNDNNGCFFYMDSVITIKDLQVNVLVTPQPACVNTEVEFDAMGTQDNYPHIYNCYETLYTIFFGDSTSIYYPMIDDTTCNPTFHFPFSGIISHTYSNIGIYDAYIVSTDTFGCFDTAFVQVNIIGPDPGFIASPPSGCLPLQTTLSPVMLNDPSIVSWHWYVENVPYSQDSQLNLNLTDTGTYNIGLLLIDNIGCKDSLFVEDFIHVVDPEPLIFKSEPGVCPGDTIYFWIDPPLSNATIQWVINGQTIIGDSIQYIPGSPGSFDVELMVDQWGCSRTFTYPDFFTCLGAVIDFNFGGNNAYCMPAFISFDFSSTGSQILSATWNFGDGTVSNITHPTHLYQYADTFFVTLTVSTMAGCYPFSKATYIIVNGATTTLDIDPFMNCLGDTINFKLLNSSNLAGYALDFGDGTPLNQNLPSDHVYFNAPLNGIVYPTLLYWAHDSTCVKSQTDSVRFFFVRAWFSRGMNGADLDTIGCEPFELGILNQSIGADIFHWSFGDGITSTEINPVHTYTVPGEYEIQLEVWNQYYGCHFANSKRVSIYETPDPLIDGKAQACAGSQIQFYSNGTADLNWQPSPVFNDHTIQNPLAVFEAPTTVYLLETNEWNCTGKDSLEIFVQQVPLLPLADTSIIIGQEIQIAGAGPYLVSYTWSPSLGLLCPVCYNPVFQPLESGQFTVTMTASIDDSICFIVVDSIYIEVMNQFSVDMPQVFTPNGDGSNDAVYVNGWGLRELQEYRIFNRWGQCIFATQDLRKGWDGTYNGNPQPPESYAYQVVAIGYDGKEYRKKGIISLIR